MAIPYIPKIKEKIKRPIGWPFQSPYDSDDAIIMSNQSVGKKTRTCKSNRSGKTIIKPEWYH